MQSRSLPLVFLLIINRRNKHLIGCDLFSVVNLSQYNKKMFAKGDINLNTYALAS